MSIRSKYYVHTFQLWNRLFRLSRLSVLLLAGALAWPQLVAAQEQQRLRAGSALMEEVVVMARKRDENQQDVPIAITAFNSDQLEALKVRELGDISFSMPNVALDDVGTTRGVANFSIRGLGINASILSIDPTVGVFVDGVYMGVNTGILFDIPDLESIEVLRGPQGVLFGRNVVGGAVLINTKKPGDEFQAKFRTAFENSDEGGTNMYYSARVAGPISDGLAAGITVYFNDDEGAHTNSFTGNEMSAIEQLMVRPVVVWNPTDDLELVARYEYLDTDGDGTAAQSHLGDCARCVPGNPFNNDDDDFSFSIDEEGKQKLEKHRFSLEANWSVGENGTITNIFGWRDQEIFNRIDVDAQPFWGFHAEEFNVMPCVLPVIAIKVLSFVQQAGEDRGRIFLLNATYSLGVISVFMLLATLATFAGTSWGGQFQSIEFLVAMSALVFVMGLSLLGVFEIPIPGFVGSSAGGHQEGLGGAFMTGIFATILATPCSGPFLGPTLGWSIQQPAHVIYMIWGMMGLGMASPYLLFGMFPGAVKFLPKPGNWMIRFKQIAGFIMLGTTVFLLSILDESYLVPTLVMLLGIGIGVWMIGNLYDLSSPPATRWKMRFAALCTAGVISGYGYHLASADEKLHWEPFTPTAVVEALAKGQPVMVDFTADWCLTCKVVEKTTLNTDSTRDVVDTHGFVTLKADWTDGSDEIRDLLNRLGGDSIPTLAVFSPVKPNEPIVLRDAWSQSTLIEQLETVVSENEDWTEAQAAAMPASILR